jgi:hypothetical protein
MDHPGVTATVGLLESLTRQLLALKVPLAISVSALSASSGNARF